MDHQATIPRLRPILTRRPLKRQYLWCQSLIHHTLPVLKYFPLGSFTLLKSLGQMIGWVRQRIISIYISDLHQYNVQRTCLLEQTAYLRLYHRNHRLSALLLVGSFLGMRLKVLTTISRKVCCHNRPGVVP
jgi:hypothetical protein